MTISTKIGEISIMKDMTKVASTMMTEEEKTEMEKELGSPTGSGTSTHIDHKAETASQPTTPPPGSKPTSSSSSTAVPQSTPQHPAQIMHGEDASSQNPPPSPTAKDAERARQREAARKRAKLTQEQRDKLREQDEERRKIMKERVAMLTTKMMERLRPFVEAKHPGDKEDFETIAFENRMKREAEDLKLESFGVEVSSSVFVCLIYAHFCDSSCTPLATCI
jgi:X-domain of DnaJ-containing